MKTKIIAFCLLAATALADIPATISKTSNTLLPPQEEGLTVIQDGSWKVDWRFLAGSSTAKNLTGANQVLFRYFSNDDDWSVTVTGSLYNATNGQITVTLKPADLATNGTYDFRYTASDGTSTLAYAYGRIEIIKNLGGGVLPLVISTNAINWSLVPSFSNGLADGPYVFEGAGFSFRINARGQVLVSNTVAAVSGTLTNLYRSGGIPITFTTPGGPNTGINISTNTIVAAVSGQAFSGTGITGVNAAQLGSSPKSYFLNWANITNHGTLDSQAGHGEAAYGWGNHGTNGYLKSYTETDPKWTSQSNIVFEMLENGQIAFGWGDHSTNGYLKSYIRSLVSPLAGCTVTITTNGTEVTYALTITAGKDWNAITNLPSTFTPSAHTHTYTAITNAPWLTTYTKTRVIGGANTTVTTNSAGDTNTYTIASSGGGGGSQTPQTNNWNGAGYKYTNTNIRANSLYVGGGQTNAGDIAMNKTGVATISGKQGTGNSLLLKQDDGNDNVIELGKNTLGTGMPVTGIVAVANGGLSPMHIVASYFQVGNGSATNFSVSAAGAVRIGGNMNANGKGITNLLFQTLQTNSTLPTVPLNKAWEGLFVVSGQVRKYTLQNYGGVVVTNYSVVYP